MASSSRASTSTGVPMPPSFGVTLAASAIAGGIEPLVTFPLEYVKTVQQLKTHIRPSSHAPLSIGKIDANVRSVIETIEAQPGTSRGELGTAEAATSQLEKAAPKPPRRTTVSAALRESLTPERGGLRNLYRGVEITALSGIGKVAVRMGTYDRLKRTLNPQDGAISGGRSLLAGLGAGLAEAIFVVIPAETMKTKIIHASTLPQDHAFYRAAIKGPRTAVRALYDIGGFRALYAGATATLMRQAGSSMTRFGTYATLKNLVGGSMRPGQKLPSGITFGLGAIAGGVTVYTTMPFDVAKTRMQSIGARARYKNTLWCMAHTVQEEGWTALWRGSTMRLCRLTLSGAVVFTIYEEVTSLAGH